MKPVVIAVAITGSVPRKKDNPAVPISPCEQIEATHEAFEAGATLVHIHVRNDDESSSSDPERFRSVQEGVIKHCPGMIVQFSTGGRGRDPRSRGSALFLKPDMASLSTGSVNFPNIVYENHTELVRRLACQMRDLAIRPEIEIFDLSHIYTAHDLVTEGLIDGSVHIQLVMGIKNAMPADKRALDILIGEAKLLLPNATWTAAGIGRYQSEVMAWALERGADAVRTGLEDNIRIGKERLAASNAELVEIAVEQVTRFGRRPANAEEARGILRIQAEPSTRIS
ncbi:3-keto-5-aminohexanoate cleavage protein [Bradyrhizobium sp. Cp5.3]|uniref:3-keto-5-aminohexanoate cleavage protein n=1 Tax=Bradyrhizobium sp. Cp5.3 TaxID=443598 RepID=UPI000404A321|nr:3-keto-5-aminohexanoate cleavage protein [Bradyrhizobium sp. Cp5.3]